MRLPLVFFCINGMPAVRVRGGQVCSLSATLSLAFIIQGKSPLVVACFKIQTPNPSISLLESRLIFLPVWLPSFLSRLMNTVFVLEWAAHIFFPYMRRQGYFCSWSRNVCKLNAGQVKMHYSIILFLFPYQVVPGRPTTSPLPSFSSNWGVLHSRTMLGISCLILWLPYP